MKKYDRISTAFLIVLALGICVESIRIDPGSLSNPGPGLIPLGCGLGLGTLGLILFGLTFTSRSQQNDLPVERGTNRSNILLVLVSIVGFAFLINVLGFHPVTFIWMIFVCRMIGRMGWKGTIFTSGVTTVSSYLLFGYFLEIRFPGGILGI